MRAIFTHKILLLSFIIGATILSLLAVNKKLYALNKRAVINKAVDERTEWPWETVTYQFAGSILFK